MDIKVTENKVILVQKNTLNKGEYNIHSCNFEFSEEYTDDLVKFAVFTMNASVYKVLISENTCQVPIEVLDTTGYLIVGVYAYEVVTEATTSTLVKRYSPEPFRILINDGSYVDNAQNSETPTPTEYEQYMQALNEGLARVQDINITATKSGKVTTITITDKNGMTTITEILDGNDGINGKDGVDGKDGEKGEKGDPGQNGKDGADGKDGIDGKDGKDGKDGQNGTNGQDGHSPVKGVDYWTSQDKQEIVNDVLSQIQDSEEVEY